MEKTVATVFDTQIVASAKARWFMIKNREENKACDSCNYSTSNSTSCLYKDSRCSPSTIVNGCEFWVKRKEIDSWTIHEILAREG